MKLKRIGAGLASVLLAVCLPLTAARAAEPEDASNSQVWAPRDGGKSPEDLFASYVDQNFYSGGVLSDAPEAPSGDLLEGLDQKLYDALKNRIKDTARYGGGTEFEIEPAELALPDAWTAEDLGAPAALPDGSPDPEALEAAEALAGFDVCAVMDALLTDLPYDFYWFDRCADVPVSYSAPEPVVRPGAEEGSLEICLEGSFRFTFAVVPEFQDGSGAVTSEVGAVRAAVKAAQAIAAAHRDESDYQKLLSFRDELSLQAGPGGKAAPGGAFGDPWQMVWALDGDPDTEASSEGWAKAFQYLCGLAGLREMECYTVSGLTQVGEDLPSPCMWNIVRAGGRSYLADVAGSLDGAAGWDGGLFLAGVRVNEDTTPSGYIADLPAGPVYYWYESGGLAPEVLDLAPCALDPAGA